jgi:hypothetical protein
MIYIISGRGFVEIYVDIRIWLTVMVRCVQVCVNSYLKTCGTQSILSGMLCVVEYSFHHYKHSQNYQYQITGLNATYIKMSWWRLYWSVWNLWYLKLGRNQHLVFWTFCLAYFGVNIHRDIILADNSHPFLSQTISYDGRQCSAYHYLNFPVNLGFVHCSSVYCCTVRFLLTLFK